MDLETITTLCGSSAFSILLFFLINKAWPDLMAARKADKDEERAERTELMDIIKHNTAALTKLEASLDNITTGIVEQLKQQTELLSDLNCDVSELYGHMRVPRPARVKKGA